MKKMLVCEHYSAMYYMFIPCKNLPKLYRVVNFPIKLTPGLVDYYESFYG